MRVALEHRGIQAELSLWGPGEKKIATGGPVSREGVEVLSLITPSPGSYSLRVAAPTSEPAVGHYDLFLEEQRPARTEDESRVAAQEKLSAGLRDRDRKNEFGKALPELKEALRLWRKAEDAEGEIDTGNEIGFTQTNLGQPVVAREQLEKTLAIAQKAGYVRGQADAWNNLGIVLGRLLRPKEALAAYERASELWKRLGDSGSQAKTLNNMGRIFYYQMYDLDRARSAFREALELCRKAGDREQEARTLTGLGVVANLQGDYKGALNHFNASLDLSRQIGDRSSEATILGNLADVYLSRGQLQDALGFYEAALADGGPGDRGQEAKILHNMASLYFRLGEPGKALARYQQVLDAHRADPEAFAFTLNSIGSDLFSLGDEAKAEEYLAHALKVSQDAKLPSPEALAFHYLGQLHRAQGKKERALDELERAFALRNKLPDLTGRARTLLEIGVAQSELHRPTDAASFLQKALDLARTLHDRSLIARCLLDQAMLDRDRGDLPSAQQRIENALQEIEAVRADVGSDQLRTSFFAAQREYYELYVDLLMRRAARDPAYEAAALEASERARARGLVDLLAEGRIDVNRGIDPDLKQSEEALVRELAATQSQLKQARQAAVPDEEAARRLEKRLLEIDGRQQALVGEIRSKNPRYAAVRYPTPLHARQIRQLLDEKTALLEYAVGRERTFLFGVTHEGLAVYPLRFGARALEDRVSKLRRALKSDSPALRFEYLRDAADLYRDLVAPAAKSLAGKTDLLISPDASLHELPFEALLTAVPATGQRYSQLPYLLRQYAISYVPSASVLAELRTPPPPPAAAKAFLAFANPFYGPPDRGRPTLQPLRRSESEARDIARLYPPGGVTVYVGREATRDAVLGNRLLEQARRIHFATHGFLDEQWPALSGLALAPGRDKDDDGFVRVHDIFDLKLNADLVVLSACETAGSQVSGEGLVGLTRAFFYAGASSLVASLWRASDDSTPELMVDFYRRLASGKAQALQAAKLNLIEKGRYASPFYWAPFVLVGEPR